MGLGAYLCVSVALFVLGVGCMLARRNLFHVLMGLVLILNSACLNFVAFAHFNSDPQGGRMFALFVIIIAAVEACVMLAIILNVSRSYRSVKPSAIDRLRE